MLSKTKYSFALWTWLDRCSQGLMFPWLLCVNFCLASCISTTGETWRCRLLHRVIVGPACFLFSLLLLPLGFAGFALWQAVCLASNPLPYSYWESPETPCQTKTNEEQGSAPTTYTILTSNTCLLPECFARYNNFMFTYKRAKEIAHRILNNCNEFLILSGEGTSNQKSFGLTTQFATADFICFQEVFERFTAWLLMRDLRHRYKYFVHSVGHSKLTTNCFCLGSGLMFASRYPILDVDFHSFKVKTRMSSLVSLGLLQVKVELNQTGILKQVGYIATTHLQSYQGKKPCIVAQLDESMGWLRRFRRATIKPDEVVAFDIFCGDFNFDNISPGDSGSSNHAVFEKYTDPCRISAGVDETWTIGTEMRQRMVWSSRIDHPDKFKYALEDPASRRYFLLDADVKIQTVELAFLKPPCDKNGHMSESPAGGKRRIDYIMYHNSYPVEVLHYNFVTALNQLTDHIPVSMTFRVRKEVTEFCT